MNAYPVIKRIIDFVLGIALVLFLAPMLILVSLLIKLDSKGPIVFVQERIGYKMRPFKILKFRTMMDKPRVPKEEILKGHPEVTSIGRFLRRSKLDEIPQILNIIKGDMSFIGPRPALRSHVDKYNEIAFLRHDVRPGLTGWAQVNGNIRIPWESRWKYDSFYAQHISFLLDLKILLKTPLVIINGRS